MLENTLHTKKKFENGSDIGETPLSFAPHVQLQNNKLAIPQHFLRYQRDVTNIENILSDIDFSPNYPLFVGMKNGVCYLQVGIIGHENYPKNDQQRKRAKIVYGRMWMIEESTPTSEVIQTALLALKKAREHELREKFLLKINTNTCTPFNNHMDLPLMADNTELFGDSCQSSLSPGCINEIFHNLKLNTLTFQVENIETRHNGQTLIDYALIPNDNLDETLFPDLENYQGTIVLKHLNQSAMLNALMEDILHTNEDYVNENFAFRGFKRFSKSINPVDVGRFSLSTRLTGNKEPLFEQQFKKMVHEVDSVRAPKLSQGKLGEKQQHSLSLAPVIDGYLPLA